MTTIELRFPAHRFHANPWGRHVNEGVPEWPPSPYRLLRALYDAWKRKRPDLPETDVASVLQALSAGPPQFGLPQATTSHTRGYLSSNAEDPTEKSLIFDAFVAVNPGAVCSVIWPSITLTDRQRNVLDGLLRVINYVGRSESWIEAQLSDGAPETPASCEPAGSGESSGEMVPVACAVPASQYHGKRSWMDALTYSTSELLKDRRSAPPVMRMVPYVRPTDALMTYVPRRPVKRDPTAVQAVLLSLDSTVLPLVTATVEVAEQIRLKLMGIHKRIAGSPALVSAMFSGKTPDGKPRAGHGHIFILPLGNGKGRIDRVLLYTRGAGFKQDEVRAILQLRSLWQSDGRPDVRCVVTWKGAATDLYIRKTSKAVASTTPFATVRHRRKGRGEPEDFLKEELRRECRNHGLPQPTRIELLRHASELFEWVEFRRNRKDDPPRDGYGFRLEFDSEVHVPFSLGYGCHFGLGQFDREA